MPKILHRYSCICRGVFCKIEKVSPCTRAHTVPSTAACPPLRAYFCAGSGLVPAQPPSFLTRGPLTFLFLLHCSLKAARLPPGAPYEDRNGTTRFRRAALIVFIVYVCQSPPDFRNAHSSPSSQSAKFGTSLLRKSRLLDLTDDTGAFASVAFAVLGS